MSLKPSKNPLWFAVTLIPTLFSAIGISLYYLASTQLWGGDDKAATVLAVFFAELNLVLCAGALMAHYKIQYQSKLSTAIFRWNIAILLISFATGLYLFLG